MPIPWNGDPPGAGLTIAHNLARLLERLIVEAPLRHRPSLRLALDWHRAIFDGVELPVPYYAGEIRDDDPRFPELIGYEVRVGPHPGVSAARVPEALERFERQMRRAIRRLDDRLPPGESPRDSTLLGSILTLCAHAHGEWARIHPCANGNGRVARLWADWCALRYGLPPFVRLRPRPESDRYARAAADSMTGDHRAAVNLFADWLERRLRG